MGSSLIFLPDYFYSLFTRIPVKIYGLNLKHIRVLKIQRVSPNCPFCVPSSLEMEKKITKSMFFLLSNLCLLFVLLIKTAAG